MKSFDPMKALVFPTKSFYMYLSTLVSWHKLDVTTPSKTMPYLSQSRISLVCGVNGASQSLPRI